MTTPDQALDAVMQLPIDQQEVLLDVVRKRHIERRREEIATDARASIAAFHAGKLKSQSLEEIISELRLFLEEADGERKTSS